MKSREDIILALVSEYDKNIKSFYNTKQQIEKASEYFVSYKNGKHYDR